MVLICAPSSGQRLNDTSLKQGAWDVLNSNTVGVWPPVTQVGVTDVINPVNEVRSALLSSLGNTNPY